MVFVDACHWHNIQENFTTRQSKKKEAYALGGFQLFDQRLLKYHPVCNYCFNILKKLLLFFS